MSIKKNLLYRAHFVSFKNKYVSSLTNLIGHFVPTWVCYEYVIRLSSKLVRRKNIQFLWFLSNKPLTCHIALTNGEDAFPQVAKNFQWYHCLHSNASIELCPWSVFLVILGSRSAQSFIWNIETSNVKSLLWGQKFEFLYLALSPIY